jgi:RNA-directed DNA polymerase
MTWIEYAEHLEANLLDLHARVHTGAYRALPSLRKYIPKADGRQRPLGIRRHAGQNRPGCGGGNPDADL